MKGVFTFYLILSSLVSLGQNTKTDSLINEISKANDDSNKVKLYYKLLVQFTEVAPKVPENYVLPAIALSEKLGIDVFPTKLLVGRIYWRMGKWDMALKYHTEALKLVDENKEPDKFAHAFTYLGQDYADAGNYPMALTYFVRVKKIYEDINDKNSLASINLLISWVHQQTGNFIESAKSNMNALRTYESINDKYGAAIASGNLASDYLILDKNKEAIYYLTRAITDLEKFGDYINLSGSQLSLAEAFINLKNYDEAIKHIEIAFEYGKKINDKIQMGNAHSLQADIYFKQNNYSEASLYYRKAIENYTEVNASHLLAKNYTKLGLCNVRLRNLSKAKSALDSAALYNKALDSHALLSDYLNGLQLYDSLRGNWKGAYLNHYKYVRIRDSLFNAENTKKLLQNQVEYEFDKKEAEAKAEQEKKDAVTQAEKQKQKIILIVVSGFLLLVAILAGFIFKNLRKTQKQKIIIEAKEKETQEQKHLIEEKQKEITDSIHYAQHLQQAILPPIELITKYFSNSFVLYKPKDIVAGDFYWAEKINNLFFIAAADCTGHGVPGAMVSVVCSNALNRSVKEFALTDTSKILDKTRELVIETFEKSNAEIMDGMDISLLCIDKQNQKIFWSGANNPLWYFHDNSLKEIKADKQPIGKTDYPKPFTTHQIEYSENMAFYLFTDGLADQFGGPNGKKFKYKQFSELLIRNQNLSQMQQADIINKAFLDWKGHLEQVDDICVIGIKL